MLSKIAFKVENYLLPEIGALHMRMHVWKTDCVEQQLLKYTSTVNKLAVHKSTTLLTLFLTT